MKLNRASISFRLTLWFVSIFLAGWVAFGAAMWVNLKSTLTAERYTTLARRLERLQDLLNRSQEKEAPDRYQDFKDFARATGGGLAEVFHSDGSRAFPAPSAAANTFPWPAIRSDRPEVFVEVEAGGQPYRVLERRLTLGRQDLVVAAAAPLAGNLLVLHRFWEGLIASAPVLLVISSLGGYWLSRRALKPVDRITATARSISIRNLSGRLPQTGTGDELERLTETCNAMLARLESAVTQIKQFTGDASHELRGPLSFVRTVAEATLRNPSIDSVSREAFQDIVDETAKAALLLEDMLTLARADSNSSGAVMERVDLSEVVKQICDLARPIAQEKNLAFAVKVNSERPVPVMGDFSSLRRLLWILLDNAMKYTEARGQVQVDLTAVAGLAKIRVTDTGIGIPATDLPHIFNRFYRADPSRSQVEGSGLGLAIAKWIAELHHADLSVSSRLGEGTSAEIVVPLTPNPAP